MLEKMKPEIYVSTDVETDGPIPGPHSMLSFASAAYLADKTLVSTFSANLETLEGATGHPDTMKWWQTPAAGVGRLSRKPRSARHRDASLSRLGAGATGQAGVCGVSSGL
jgi:hypothetical protein